MSIYLVVILTILIGISVYLFKTGRIKEALGLIAGAGIVGTFWPRREREKTPFQELDAIQKDVIETKKKSDAAIVAAEPEIDHTKTRRKRWEEL